MSDVDVTILMPMLNAWPYVARAVDSILAERGVSLELLIINDQSTDASAAFVRQIHDKRVRVLEGKREGIAASFNLGLSEARGELLMRCDSDDWYPFGRISEQVRWMKQYPEAVAVCGSFVMTDDQGKEVRNSVQRHPREADITEELRSGVTRTHLCTYAMRTAAVRKLGGCRSFFEVAEDLDLQTRLAGQGAVIYRPQTTYFYRLHDNSITHSKPSNRRLRLTELAGEFARQRRDRSGESGPGKDDLQLGDPPTLPEDDGPQEAAKTHVRGMLLGRAWEQHAAGHKWAALRTLTRAIRKSPGSWALWKSLVALCLKPARPMNPQEASTAGATSSGTGA